MEATITKSTGSWYLARTDDGVVWQSRTRGKLRLQVSDTSNPVAVGDRVLLMEDVNFENTAIIKEIFPRENYIIRKANKLSSKRQILATNLDAAILVASMFAPRTSLGFIDRFLLGCQAYHVPAILFMNKIDMLGDNIKQVQTEFHRIYANAEVEIMYGSALDPNSVGKLLNRIRKQRILLAGHSGVGKSTLLNALYPEFDAKVGSISETHMKGKHTTTFAEMFTTQDGTQLIDTPGIRDFGVVDIEANEIPQYFPEFRNFMNKCKFSNCTHTHEPKCAVLENVENGNIPEERYYSYQSILNNEDIYK
ncbi:MAG: ribosome small subunit-dependent GTPase A [Bacteroidia bacterium]